MSMSAMIQPMCVSRYVITQLDHTYVLVKQDILSSNNRSCDGRKSTVLLHIMIKYHVSFFSSSFLCPQMSMNVILIMEIVLKSV